MRVDTEAILKAHQEQQAAKLATFRVSLNLVDDRALAQLVADYRRKVARDPRNAWYQGKLDACLAAQRARGQA
ncbi:hypothetical protein GCM10027258_62600 [Amycolatopsis stemonae]